MLGGSQPLVASSATKSPGLLLSWVSSLTDPVRREGESGKPRTDKEETTMGQYLLATYRVEDDVPGAPSSPEEMQEFMQRVIALEAEMDATGTFVFGGALHGVDAATVVGITDGEVVMTDGPFAESKEHIAGFYIINADDLDAALAWGRKTADATRHPIEVRPFFATGKVADQMHKMPDA
jgi:hypothetical protein